MRLRGAGCRAGACGTLDGAKVEPPGFRGALESRENVPCRSHVPGFFLHPDDFARVGMFLEGSGDFRARQRVELVKKENGGIRVLAAAAFGAALVAAFSAGDPDAASVLHFAVGDNGEEARLSKLLDYFGGVRMTQPDPPRDDDQTP